MTLRFSLNTLTAVREYFWSFATRVPRALVAVILFAPCFARPVEAQNAAEYERRELKIPMRDGVNLFAVALIPKGVTAPLPVILIRTPFSAAREFGKTTLPVSLRELGEDGYIFVCEDIRGRFGSGGTYVTLRPLRDVRDSHSIDESTDAWDTIDWLVRELPHNTGKVGVLGVSYRGWLAAMAGVGAHPSLKAISPQAPVADVWLGDDFFHQGAFRQTQGVAYSAFIEGSGDLSMPEYDQFDFYRRHITLDDLAKSTGVTRLPSWVGFQEHPAYDAYWEARALQKSYSKPEVPTLMVGGWWDEEDLLGPQIMYRTLERSDTSHRNFLVMGPWSHGEWSRPGGDSLGPVRFGSNTADYFRANIQRPWFAYYLHGKGDGRFPKRRSSKVVPTNGARSTHGRQRTPRPGDSTLERTVVFRLMVHPQPDCSRPSVGRKPATPPTQTRSTHSSRTLRILFLTHLVPITATDGAHGSCRISAS